MTESHSDAARGRKRLKGEKEKKNRPCAGMRYGRLLSSISGLLMREAGRGALTN